MLQEAGVELPWTTRALIFVSDILLNYWWLIIVAVIGVAAGFRGLDRHAGWTTALGSCQRSDATIFGTVPRDVRGAGSPGRSGPWSRAAHGSSRRARDRREPLSATQHGMRPFQNDPGSE